MDEYKKKRKRIARHERKRELARNADPRCSICGEDRVEMLELDHTAGDANGELTNWVCRNHHAAISDRWCDDSRNLLLHDAERDADARLAGLLQGLVYFLDELIVKLRDWVEYLLNRSRYHQEHQIVDSFDGDEPR